MDWTPLQTLVELELGKLKSFPYVQQLQTLVRTNPKPIMLRYIENDIVIKIETELRYWCKNDIEWGQELESTYSEMFPEDSVSIALWHIVTHDILFDMKQTVSELYDFVAEPVSANS